MALEFRRIFPCTCNIALNLTGFRQLFELTKQEKKRNGLVGTVRDFIILSLIGGGIAGWLLEALRKMVVALWLRRQAKKGETFLNEVLAALQKHGANPIFDAQDFRDAFFPKKNVADVLDALRFWQEKGLAHSFDCGSLSGGPRTGWMPK